MLAILITRDGFQKTEQVKGSFEPIIYVPMKSPVRIKFEKDEKSSDKAPVYYYAFHLMTKNRNEAIYVEKSQ